MAEVIDAGAGFVIAAICGAIGLSDVIDSIVQMVVKVSLTMRPMKRVS